MPAFLIADIRVINRDKYEEYRVKFRACVKRHRGFFLAAGQEPQVVQGGWHPPRMLVVEFAHRADAAAMLASDEYRALEDQRGNCAMFDIITVDGIAASRHVGREAAPVLAIADTRIVNRPAFEEFSRSIDQAVRAIGNLRNHLNGAPGTKIVVVALGHGIEFLVEGAKDAQGRPFDAPVAALASMGVEFRVCHNSLMAFKVPEDKLLLEAKVVPARVVEITRLQQEEGFAYLKP